MLPWPAYGTSPPPCGNDGTSRSTMARLILAVPFGTARSWKAGEPWGHQRNEAARVWAAASVAMRLAALHAKASTKVVVRAMAKLLPMGCLVHDPEKCARFSDKIMHKIMNLERVGSLS